MISPSVSMSYQGRPISVLQQLIAERQKVLGESVKDAVVATAIDALVSIRAATASAAKRKKFKTVVEDTGWYGGFSRTDNRPCIRAGVGAYSQKIELKHERVKWLVRGVRRQADRHVYRVTPEHGQVRTYYVVAATPGIAAAFEARAARHRVDTFGALAKNALAVAMGKVSTRNVKADGSPGCVHAASRLAHVWAADIGDDYAVKVTDELDYAIHALKGGRGMVDVALKKAANKIAGRLSKVAGKSFKDRFGTPFPEVRRKRKK